MDVIDVQEQAGHLLAALRQAEFAGRLDGVDRVAARVGQAHHLCLAGLGLQQVGREVAGTQRMARGAQHRAAVGLDHVGGGCLQRVAESVVGRQEVPGLAAFLDGGARGGVGQRPGVVGVVHGIGRAQVVGDALGAGPAEHHDLLLFAGHFQHGQRGRGTGHVHDGVHLLRVVPLACLGGGDIGLVLVVHHHQVDLLAQHRAAEIGDGHLGRGGAALAGHVGVDAAHVQDQAQPDDVVRDGGGLLRPGGGGRCRQQGGRGE
ncbi:hypothetical protein D3C78_1156520 [compost metagenome]